MIAVVIDCYSSQFIADGFVTETVEGFNLTSLTTPTTPEGKTKEDVDQDTTQLYP